MKVKVLEVKNVDIKGLSNFYIEKLQVDMASKTASITLNVRRIEGGADYELDAMAYGIFPLEGKGFANILVKDNRFFFDVKFDLNHQTQIEILSMKMQTKIGDLSLNLEGLNGAKPGSRLEKYFDEILSKVAPILWKKFEQLVTKNILVDFKDFFNIQFARCPLNKGKECFEMQENKARSLDPPFIRMSRNFQENEDEILYKSGGKIPRLG